MAAAPEGLDVKKQGYYGIGIYKTKTEANVGTLWRSAHIFGAAFIFTVGKRYKYQASDTTKAPCHVPLLHFATIDDLRTHLPCGCKLVGVEIAKDAILLEGYCHPARACYVLGAEDGGLPGGVLSECHDIVQLSGDCCMNVAVAGSILIYHRQVWAANE